MSRTNLAIPVAFGGTPAPPASAAAGNLDVDYDYLLGLIQDSSNGFVTAHADSGTANAYAVNLNSTIAPSGYANGMTVGMTIGNTNTGASTLNVNSLGTIPILTLAGNALTANYLVAGNFAVMVYDNGNFYVITAQSTGASGVLNEDLGTISTATATVNCLGFSAVNINLNYTGTTAFTLILTNLAIGTQVYYSGYNNATSAHEFLLNATLPNSTPITPIVAFAYFNSGTGTSFGVDLIGGFDAAVVKNNRFAYQGPVTTVNGAPQLFMIGGAAAATS